MDGTDWSIRALLYSYNQHLGFTLDKTILNRIIMAIYTSNSFSNIFIRILPEYSPIPLPHLKRSFHSKTKTCLKSPGGTSISGCRGGLDLIKFGGKIWGKIRPSSPNKRKNLGSSVTTRRKSWEKILILGSNQKVKFGVFVTYIFGGKIWGCNKNFRGKFWGQAPPTS